MLMLLTWFALRQCIKRCVQRGLLAGDGKLEQKLFAAPGACWITRAAEALAVSSKAFERWGRTQLGGAGRIPR